MSQSTGTQPLDINLVLNPANQSWIIEKIATQLKAHLERLGDRVTITDTPLSGADIVHHMSWAFARTPTNGPSTMFVTHLDDIYKLNEVRDTLTERVDVGICMSRDTMGQLVAHGVQPRSVTFVNPAHDGLAGSRRTVIGLTTRLYADGRKREVVLLDVARRMSLEGFEFQIFGDGWEKAVSVLESSGARVVYHPESGDFRSDHSRILKGLERFDYYLYLGMDEGSLGTLDALYAGVPTIVTPQGFHLDAAHGITHSVVFADDLERTFREIDDARRLRHASVAGWTWEAYAASHREIWLATIQGMPPPVKDIGAEAASAREFQRRALYVNALSIRRMLSALSHTDLLSGLRQRLRAAKRT